MKREPYILYGSRFTVYESNFARSVKTTVLPVVFDYLRIRSPSVAAYQLGKSILVVVSPLCRCCHQQ